MTASTRSNLSHLFRGIAWLLFGLAGIAFWFGGGVISAVTNTDRLTGEIAGIGFAAVLAGLGATAKGLEDHFEIGGDGDGPTSLGDAPVSSSPATEFPVVRLNDYDFFGCETGDC